MSSRERATFSLTVRRSSSVYLRSSTGFTLIEMLILAIIVLILAAVALPPYIGTQDKTREATVKNNMRVAQVAAEGYAAEKGGVYPDKVNEGYFSFFPGGPGDGKTVGAARGIENPYTHKIEWPIQGNVTDVDAVRQSPPTNIGGAGQVEYSPITGANGVRTYAIRGARQNGDALAGATPMSTFVLTRQN